MRSWAKSHLSKWLTSTASTLTSTTTFQDANCTNTAFELNKWMKIALINVKASEGEGTGKAVATFIIWARGGKECRICFSK